MRSNQFPANIKYLSFYKNSLFLPDILRQVIIGLILGDCCAYMRNPRGDAVLKFGQSIIHVDYLLFLWELMSLYVATPPKFHVYTKSDGTIHKVSVLFETLSFPFFTEIYRLFYVEGVKRVPSNIFELLTPIGLAYWFHDDGTKAGSGFLLHTDGFHLEDVKLLSDTESLRIPYTQVFGIVIQGSMLFISQFKTGKDF